MTIRKTIDLTRQQNALRGVLAGAVDDVGASGLQVIWADSSVPRPARPYASLRIDSGPMMEGALKEFLDVRQAPDDVTATVGAVLVDDLLTLRVNGVSYRRTVTGIDTPTTVAAAIVADIEADAEQTASAANVGPIITLTPDFVGAIFAVDEFPVASWTIVENPTTQDVTDMTARNRMTISVDVFQLAHVNIDNAQSAQLMAARMRTVLDDPRSQAVFDDERVAAMAITPVQNVSAPDTGGEMQGQANFDIDFHVTSLVTFPTATIDSVAGIGITISGNVITFTVPEP